MIEPIVDQAQLDAWRIQAKEDQRQAAKRDLLAAITSQVLPEMAEQLDARRADAAYHELLKCIQTALESGSIGG